MVPTGAGSGRACRGSAGVPRMGGPMSERVKRSPQQSLSALACRFGAWAARIDVRVAPVRAQPRDDPARARQARRCDPSYGLMQRSFDAIKAESGDQGRVRRSGPSPAIRAESGDQGRVRRSGPSPAIRAESGDQGRVRRAGRFLPAAACRPIRAGRRAGSRPPNPAGHEPWRAPAPEGPESAAPRTLARRERWARACEATPRRPAGPRAGRRPGRRCLRSWCRR